MRGDRVARRSLQVALKSKVLDAPSKDRLNRRRIIGERLRSTRKHPALQGHPHCLVEIRMRSIITEHRVSVSPDFSKGDVKSQVLGV